MAAEPSQPDARRISRRSLDVGLGIGLPALAASVYGLAAWDRYLWFREFATPEAFIDVSLTEAVEFALSAILFLLAMQAAVLAGAAWRRGMPGTEAWPSWGLAGLLLAALALLTPAPTAWLGLAHHWVLHHQLLTLVLVTLAMVPVAGLVVPPAMRRLHRHGLPSAKLLVRLSLALLALNAALYAGVFSPAINVLRAEGLRRAPVVPVSDPTRILLGTYAGDVAILYDPRDGTHRLKKLDGLTFTRRTCPPLPKYRYGCPEQ